MDTHRRPEMQIPGAAGSGPEVSSGGQDLPEFKSPPVIEVVCGVQFEPLPGFLSVHFGEFWARIRDRYPRTEDRPPLGELRETDQGTTVNAELVADMPPLRRVFYVDPTGNFLLQVQPTRFLSNWRKERPADAYPRYVTAFQRFSSGWTAFVDFATEASFGVPRTNQYELTYINHIEEPGERFPAGIGQYLPLLTWGGAQSTGFLPAPRNALLRLQFALPDGSGRLHVTVNHGLGSQMARGFSSST